MLQVKIKSADAIQKLKREVMEHHIIESADGSSSLMLNNFSESYHSSNGAFTEALHIYIREGVCYLFNKLQCSCINNSKRTGQFHPIVIFDIGLGSALNCLAVLLWQQTLARSKECLPQIHYIGIEKYPIPAEEAKLLNFPEHIAERQAELNGNTECRFCREEIRDWYESIHDARWEENFEMAPGFTLTKRRADIAKCCADDFKSCLYPDSPSAVFYDTFSPSTQPDLWEKSIFEEIFKGIAPGSVLTTYCSKGVVKQRLRESGFHLERLTGPPGKRHILRACKL